MKTLSIKYIFSTIVAVLLVATLCASAFADNKTEARRTLEQAVLKMSKTLNNADLTGLQEDSPILIDLEKQILGIFSLEQFSMRTVGKAWRKFSPSQQAAFKDSFVELLKTTYFSHVSEYDENEIIFTGERTNKKGTKVEVLTTVYYKGKDLPVNYRMIQENGNWMVYDVLVEGVSMVQNYRTQFKDIIRKGSPESLILKLQEKAAQIRQNRINSNNN